MCVAYAGHIWNTNAPFFLSIVNDTRSNETTRQEQKITFDKHLKNIYFDIASRNHYNFKVAQPLLLIKIEVS